jgi:hypothetical protein
MDLEMEIVSANPDFNFKAISLANPQPLNGQTGFYFTQLSVGDENKALCLQLPECLTKQGIVNIKNAKYLDLMFERSSNDELMRWIEQLEYACQDIIDANKELWFESDLTRDDIETMMTQVTRLYQSGKYMLMRVFVETGSKPGSKCIAYDENEMGFDLDILEPTKSVIPLIMIEGVKFSSRSFEISLKVVQVMVMGKNEKKTTCLIKRQLDKELDLPREEEEPRIEPQVETQVEMPLPVTPMPTLAKPTLAKPTLAKPMPATPMPTLAKPMPATPMPTLAKPMPATTKPAPPLVKNVNEMEEVMIDYNTIENDTISLKNPNDVYQELYKKAREKAKQCRIAAIEAYLEAKQIKTKYMLYDEDESDDLSDDDIISDDEN